MNIDVIAFVTLPFATMGFTFRSELKAVPRVAVASCQEFCFEGTCCHCEMEVKGGATEVRPLGPHKNLCIDERLNTGNGCDDQALIHHPYFFA